MAKRNRTGARDTGTRDKLLDACAHIMLTEGYAAATSRRIADEVGVQRALVYYYFPTMDELYLAVLRRGSEITLETQRAALTTDQPLHALWDLTVDPRGVALLTEFMALGNHRKEIRAELAAGAEKFREAQVAALTVILRSRTDNTAVPPDVVSVLIAAVGRLIVLEAAMGITTGHANTMKLVHEFLDDYELTPPQWNAEK
ncbi:TetR/AcrR family transcriptional regulator [Mycolicibacterium sp. 050232]|uniref:TetR/AcrR family transcriptional regulator n=1 Tax=Mycolicibacterium sp. 050232 TaxID=3113982 RepID=UPI002E283C3E|nr:TetR/AcrR family transcriptional regulator [Mycolicibacterium sp. 050232]MED5811326.1 TetR/AcrR family transcriptional regulator [Mycolicibacterium sp. 050232]